MGERAADELRYRAFLSYSHKDAAAAGRLHRRLETYRMPRRLVGTETERGIVPARLWPIFRDREELPAATDLSETVREALARSGALIILCSAHAVASLWVAEEIETFRALHPDRPILAAILDGDPPDCFPAALRALGSDGTWHEPLATDLRPGKDGAHLGLLKLVAGITGVGLDGLVQRDAARRVRRVMAVTGAALIALLIMAALAWFALDARREAERQRAEAEGLIEFMLTNLRQRLEGSVGQLDIMAEVNRRALQYYSGQEQLGALNRDSLQRRAMTLRLMGQDEIQRGHYAAALLAFEEAHRTTGFLLRASPNDPRLLFDHGQDEYWIGRVHELGRNWVDARRRYEHYAAAARLLIGIAPENPDYMMEMGWGAQNLGQVQLHGFRQLREAQESFEQAVHWFRRAAAARPGNENIRVELAKAYGWLGETYHMRRMWQPSLSAYRRQHEIFRQSLEARPGNIQDIYRLALAERSVARLLSITGNAREARIFLARAYERSSRLHAHDPDNAEWLLLKTKIECDVLVRAPDLPGRLDPAEARRNVAVAYSALRTQRYSRLAELQPCENHASQGNP